MSDFKNKVKVLSLASIFGVAGIASAQDRDPCYDSDIRMWSAAKITMQEKDFHATEINRVCESGSKFSEVALLGGRYELYQMATEIGVVSNEKGLNELSAVNSNLNKKEKQVKEIGSNSDYSDGITR